VRPEIDERDREILADRQAAYERRPGPRVGDWVLMPDGSARRFTYDWGDGLQTTCGDGDAGSFYIGDGYLSYSGTLDHTIPRERLRECPGDALPGRVWFFHHDWHRADNGVHFEIPFRVFQVLP
jgi:hypothetical protein